MNEDQIAQTPDAQTSFGNGQMIKRTTDINDIGLGVIRARMHLHFLVTPKGDRQTQKFFVIGHPRNGTTTLHKLFLANGVNSIHSPGDWRTGHYDAFSDFGQLRPVAAYDRTYPNAKFILNFRPLRKYLISVASHHQKTYTVQNFVNEIWRQVEYFSWALRHFKGRSDFMAINIEHSSFPAVVADFCDLAVAAPLAGSVHNASNRGKTPENLQNIEDALALLGLTEEAGKGCLVSSLHGAERDSLVAIRDTVYCVE